MRVNKPLGSIPVLQMNTQLLHRCRQQMLNGSRRSLSAEYTKSLCVLGIYISPNDIVSISVLEVIKTLQDTCSYVRSCMFKFQIWCIKGGLRIKVKGKVFYGQQPPSGESTTTECGFNYQLLAVIY